ncbi:hypothetical protein J5X84_04690 [Streptosporangiaceae bacterium NEAU-GS5]|nr:hypothetical protein [Streptosporangiaceae bacterium NEAU-GS5]
MTRSPLPAVIAVTATLVTSLAAACSSAPSAAPARSAPPTVKDTGPVYVTGARSDDNACTRVVSAIGYIELDLLPAGQEDVQPFDTNLRGRFGYLEGTIAMYGAHLPDTLKPATDTMNRIAHILSSPATTPGSRPGYLREYRRASGKVTKTCKQA